MRRYIDADKLQEEFKELHGGKRSLLIDAQPTADVRENVKGHWMKVQQPSFDQNGRLQKADCFVCENCGGLSLVEYNYCPNCGADMRGEA